MFVDFDVRASEEVIQLCGKISERCSFGLSETSVVGNHRRQNLNQLDEVDEIGRLEEIGNDASARNLADKVEAIAPDCVFTAQFPDGGDQRPGSDDFHRFWIRCRFHVKVCHSCAFEFVEKRRHGEICSSLHTCLSKRLLHVVVHPALVESDIDVAVDDVDRVRKRSFLKPLPCILHEVVFAQFDECMVSEGQQCSPELTRWIGSL